MEETHKNFMVLEIKRSFLHHIFESHLLEITQSTKSFPNTDIFPKLYYNFIKHELFVLTSILLKYLLLQNKILTIIYKFIY